jgi:hypothetical protein
MPTSIVIAAVAAVAEASVAATIAAGVLTFGFSVQAFATILVLSTLSGLLTKKQSASSSLAADSMTRTEVVRSAAAARQIIYGKAMASGPLVFAGSTDDVSYSPDTLVQTVTVSGTTATMTQANLTAITDVSFSYTVYSGDGNYNSNYYLTAVAGAPGPGQFQITAQTGSTATITLNSQDVAMYGTSVQIGYGYNKATVNKKNAYLHMVVAIAGHQVDAIQEIYLNDQLAIAADGTVQPILDSNGNPTGNTFVGFVTCTKYLGTSTQAADANLIAAFPGVWSSAHRLQGVAYLYLKLKYDATVFPQGIPNVKAVVRGRQVYDPRTGLTAWSNNWALCVRDYLTADFGLAVPSTEINDTTFIAAANSCDESVALISGSQVRYTCDGVIDLSSTPLDIMKQMMTAGAGTVVYTQGAFRCFAGVYSAPVASLTESDLRDKMTVQPTLSMKDTYNAVRGTFIDPKQYWTGVDFPPVTNALYQSQDNGVQQFRDIELPFTTDEVRAQRIAKIYLEKSRQSITVQFPAKFTAFKVSIWDRITLSISQMGWSNKVFLVTGWRFADGGVDLVLQEDTSSAYDWAYGNATTYDTAPNTNLPAPGYVQPPGQPSVVESLYASNNAVVNRATVSWAQAGDAFARYYELQYSVSGRGAWTSAPNTTATSQSIDNLSPGLWDFRVRTISYTGIPSAWQQATVQLYGKTAPPADIQNLQLASLNDTTCQLSWTQAPDLDVQIGGFIRVRYSPATSGATWTNAIDIGPALPGVATNVMLPLQAGTYLVKAIDSSNNSSVNATAVVTDVPAVANTNVIVTITESPGFAGTKSGTYVTDVTPIGLALQGGTNIDSVTANIDTWSLIDFLGGLASSGTYNFQNTFDLGAVYASKLTATLTVQAFDTGDYIDAKTGLVDTWNFIDGAVPDNVNAQLQVRTTNDDPSGTPTWSAWEPFFVGTYTARAFQFKIVINTGASNQNMAVTGCQVVIDMPDRVEQASSITSSASVPTAISFAQPFKATPAIGITANNLASGDYWVISAQSASGFSIIFKNSAGTQVSRTFDWMAKGYGRKVA